MPEEVLFKFEREMDRGEIADYLRTVADTLDGSESLSLEAGSDSVSMDVPSRPTFEIKAERETDGSGAELSVEFELEWPEGADDGGDGGDLRIE